VLLFTRPPKTAMMNKKLLPIILTILFNRTTLQAMVTFFTKPENMNNAAMKMRSGGKAG